MESSTETTVRRPRLGYSAFLLGVVAMLAGGALTFAHVETRGPIAQRMAEDRRVSLQQVIPPTLHDNNMLKDTLVLTINGAKKTFYRATKNGRVVAVAYQMTAKGYSGPILLLMAVNRNGSILGVRAVSQHETPGLGDKIDIRKTHWILGFNGHSLGNPGTKGWHVKKDGGIFDQFTGATITPRGVVAGVHRGLEVFAAHRKELLAHCTAAPGNFSGSPAGQMQGACAQEGSTLSSTRNAAGGSPAARPKGAPHNRHARVAALDKGTTIACAQRLGLTAVGSSEDAGSCGAVRQTTTTREEPHHG